MQTALVDPFGRRIDYLRLSVTDRCNYRCFYCLREEEVQWQERREFLDFAELIRLVRIFTELGVSRVRLTGGEPLMRRNLWALTDGLSALAGLRELSLSTNGDLLAAHAARLRASGVNRVNISLDSLSPATFARITGGADLRRVLAGVDAAIEAGMAPVKLNMVVMDGINDGELEAMLAFARERAVQLRFIETMPIGAAGLSGTGHFYSAEKILQRVRAYFGDQLIPVKGGQGAGPARLYQVGGGPTRVGVISAMSRHFCASCNRIRLTAKGELVLCLGEEGAIDLRPVLREQDDRAVKAAIVAAIARKPERHHFGEGQVPLRAMSALGG